MNVTMNKWPACGGTAAVSHRRGEFQCARRSHWKRRRGEKTAVIKLPVFSSWLAYHHIICLPDPLNLQPLEHKQPHADSVKSLASPSIPNSAVRLPQTTIQTACGLNKRGSGDKGGARCSRANLPYTPLRNSNIAAQGQNVMTVNQL